ncbi:hypothetical protein K010075C41_13260 [Sellimonas intestinalis]
MRRKCVSMTLPGTSGQYRRSNGSFTPLIVTASATEGIGKVMPLDEEISEEFQQLRKKMIEQDGKQ